MRMVQIGVGGQACRWGVICAVTLCACGGDGGGGAVSGELQVIGNIGFADAFPLVSEVRLSHGEEEPLGYASDLLVTEDGFVVADRIQSNIRVFDRDGSPIRTMGRPGDGPGELRSPVVLAESPGGGFVVGEIGARLHWYAPGDRLVNALGQLPSSRMVGLELVGPDTTFLVSGNHADGDRRFGAFIWSPSDGARDLIHPVPRSFEEPYRTNLWNVRAVMAGGYYVSLDQSESRLRLTDPADLATSEWRLADGGYEPPDWPDQSPSDIDALMAWARDQWWGSVLVPVGDRIVVGFERGSYSTNLRRDFSYVVVDLRHRTQIVIGEHTPVRFEMARGDTIFGVSSDEYGQDVRVSSHLLTIDGGVS